MFGQSWIFVFPWLAPLLLVGLIVMAINVLPVRYLRYAMALLLSLWWIYGFWINYAIFSGV